MAITFNHNDKFYVNGSNVGIGTSTPEWLLQLHESTSGPNYIKITNSATSEDGGNGMLIGISSSEVATIWNYENTNMRFATNGTERVTITNIGRVGIGTTAPSRILHIRQDVHNGIGSVIRLENSTGGGDNKVGILLTDGTYNSWIKGGRYDSETKSFLSFETTDSEAVRIDGDGNVGIGTSSPGAKLAVEVAGTADVIKFTRDAGANGEMTFDFSSANSNFYSNQGGFTFSGSSSSYGVNFTYDGNVGIGTTSPAATLHISKGSNNSPTVFRIENVDTTIETAQEVNTIQFYTNDGSTSGTGITSKIVQVAENPGNQYGLSFYTYDLGLAEALRITNDGNVGIGTTSPSHKLQVQNGNIGLYSDSYGNTGMIRFFGTDNVERLQIGSVSGGAFIYTPANQYFSIFTGGSENMRITAGGNVGIGTTSPASKLHINTEDNPTTLSITRGGTNLSASTSIGRISFDADYSGSLTNYGYISLGSNNISGVRGSMDFAVKSTSGNVISGMTLYGTNAGVNVGIGQTAPNARLEVRDSVNDIQMRVGSLTAGRNPFVRLQGQNVAGDTNVYADIGLDAENQMLYLGDPGTSGGTTSANPIRIDASGRLLIGTSTIYTTGGNAQVTIKNSGTGATPILSAGSSNSELIYFRRLGDGQYQFQTYANSSNSGKISLQSYGGEVGIGTTNPSYKLDVAGSVKAHSFGVEENTYTRVLAPAGASYNGGSSVTGRLTVVLPQAGLNSMLRFTIRVFDYVAGESFDVFVAGYSYSTSFWTRQTAYIISDAGTDRNFTVRFGYTPSGKAYVSIGELTSTWTYVKFSVIDAEISHSGTSLSNWDDGWDCIVVSDDTGYTVNQTVTNAQVTNWRRNGQNIYYGSGSGNVGIGTTSPTYKLHVNGAAYASDNITAAGYVFANGEGLGTSLRVGGIHANLGLYVASGYNMQFDLGWDGAFTWTRGNAERMRINSNGTIRFNSYGAGILQTDASGNITASSASTLVQSNVYSPKSWTLSANTYTAGGQNISSTSTNFFQGTTPVTRTNNTTFTVNASGTYEIRYQFVVKNNYADRCVVGAQVTDASNSTITGSRAFEYLRYTTYGEYATITATFYVSLDNNATVFLKTAIRSGSLNYTLDSDTGANAGHISFRLIKAL